MFNLPFLCLILPFLFFLLLFPLFILIFLLCRISSSPFFSYSSSSMFIYFLCLAGFTCIRDAFKKKKKKTLGHRPKRRAGVLAKSQVPKFVVCEIGTWILRPPPPLRKCPKFSTDQHLGFCFDPLPPFGPMSQSLLFF